MNENSASIPFPWYYKILFVLGICILLPILVVGVLIFLATRYISRFVLLLRVRQQWIARGIYILFVYSNNPTWKTHVETTLFPRIKEHAVILNWSERKQWKEKDQLAVTLFKHWTYVHMPQWTNRRSGGQDFNHLAIVFRPWYRPKVFRFWKAWEDSTFGRTEKLEKMERDFFQVARMH